MYQRLLILLILTINILFAGGSSNQVEILQFSTYSDNKYVLVTKPIHRDSKYYKDPYMGECEYFTIIGGYRELGFFEKGSLPNKEKYDKAISYLLTNPKYIELGWMDEGFRVLNQEYNCVVDSRSLEVYINEDNSTTIMSFYEYY